MAVVTNCTGRPCELELVQKLWRRGECVQFVRNGTGFCDSSASNEGNVLTAEIDYIVKCTADT